MVQREIDLLRSRGHQVEVEYWDNHELKGWKLVKTALNCVGSQESKRRVAEILRKNRPDLCHVHNFFPQITPTVYEACNEARVPVVQTLHNYRILCANALFLRDGRPCELCLSGSPWNGVLHRCYRNSALATIPVVQMIQSQRKEDAWNQKVDQFVALTEFARGKFLQGGLRADKVSLRRNYSEDLGLGSQSGGYAIYLGRISAEKGLLNLINSWKAEYPQLKIVGDGDLSLPLAGKKNIELINRLPRNEAIQLLKEARFSILPTECYEGGTPSALIESLSVGTPILASRIGGIPEVIQDGEDGLLFSPGKVDSLQSAVDKFLAKPDQEKEFSRRARGVFSKHFTLDRAYEDLLAIYRKVNKV